MKIKRSTVKSCDAVELNDAVETCDVTPVPETTCTEETPCCPYECAIGKIQEAIDVLCPLAKDDTCAQEALANLSVVLFDLKQC